MAVASGHRPTEFCAKCGEYVKLDWVFNHVTRSTVQKLIHITADGGYIYRNHAPVPEKEN